MLAEEKDDDSRQGIQSIEVGLPLLKVLADHGAPMMLRGLANAAGMPAAKAQPGWYYQNAAGQWVRK